MARRSICLLLAFQLAMVSSAPRWSPCVRGEEGKADAGADLRARKRERERLERLFRAVSAVSLEAPRDAFDPQGVIDRVGREPSRLFAWVRDETIWVPYAGLLRRPEGVLMDRMGNSLDRSLLLARLLQGSGHQARLVQGEIPLERARELLDRLRSNPSREEESGSAGDSRSAGARAREICDRFGIDFDEIQRSRAAFEVESSRLAEDVTSWTEEQTRQILSLVGEPPDRAAPDAQTALAALQDHWWVEVREEKEWRALDVLLPDGAAGQRAAEPALTLDLDSSGAVPGLDAALHHTLHVRFVVEGWTGGRLQESVVLEKELRPGEVHDRRITLRQVPLGWPPSLDLSKEKDPLAKLKQLVLEEKEWLPLIIVGSERASGGSFTSTGAVMTGTDRGGTVAVGRRVARSLGGLGGGLGGGGDDKAEPAGVLTAEWIEYELRSPGRAPRKVRREVFDLVGPAARRKGSVAAPVLDEPQRLLRGLSILDEVELLPLSSRLSRGYVEAAMVRGLAAHQDFFLDTIAPPDAAGRGKQASRSAEAAIPGPLQSLALARWSWSRDRQSLYQDSLNLFAFHVRLRPRTDGEIIFAHGYDIIANELGSRDGPTPGSFHARLRQGVLETQIEAKLLTPVGEVKNTGELMARSGAQGVEWVLVRDVKDPIWGEVEIPPDVKSRIEDDLAAGFIAVLPRKGVALDSGAAFGWWRVHPETGETLGRMEHGEGQSTVEKVITNMILMAPSAYAAAAGYICTKMGKSDGACNPCLIAAVGLLGLALGFVNGAVAFTLGEKSFVMWFGMGAYGAWSNGKRIVGCVNKMAG